MARTNSLHRAAAPKIDLDQIVTRQRGLVTRRQVLAAGLDDEWIRREIKNGKWQRVLPGLYATFTGPLTLEHRRVAGMLYTRGSAQLTGLAALVWHGFRQLPTVDQIHLLVPHDQRRSSHSFLRIQRTLRLDPEPHQGNGYPVCSAPRAVGDACRALDDLRTVRAIVAEAVQRRRTTIAALRHELDLARTSRTRLLRIAVCEVADGARSAPEIDLKHLLSGSEFIDRMLWNPQLAAVDGTPLPSPDGWIGEAGIALEVDSREYHLSPDDWQRTMRRHNLLAEHGVLVLHFTPAEIRGRPEHVRRIVEQAYRQRASEGATRVGVQLVSPVFQEGAPLTV